MTISFRDDIVGHLPALKRFATKLTKNRQAAHDLVGDTVLRAMTNEHQFAPGTNLKGWVFTIMMNQFLNGARRRSRNTEISFGDSIDFFAGPRPGAQEHAVLLKETVAAMARLPEDQCYALILIGVDGHSYQEAAELAGCAEGTMKSRTSRARAALAEAIAA